MTVNVSSPSQVGGVQTSVTDAQGIYRFPALHPGIYEMEASLSGFKTVQRSDITLTLGTTTTIDVALSVASVAETVQVVGESPVVDIKSSASNTQLSTRCSQNLPTGRFQPDIINLTPGVAANVAYGGAQSSNALLMDGVDVSDPEAGTPWSFFNYNWVEQIQVVVARRQRRVRRLHRRGGEQHHPLGQQQGARSRRVPHRTQELGRQQHDVAVGRAAERPSPRAKSTATGTPPAQIGFPIVKDKLFMFSGFQYFNREDRPAGYTGDFTTEKDPRTLSKLTWAVSPKVRAEGFLEVRPLQHSRPRRQRDASDHRRHGDRAVAGVELERPDHLDDRFEDDAQRAQRRLLRATSRSSRRRRRRVPARFRISTA